MDGVISPRLAPALWGFGICAIAGAVTTLVNTVLPNFYTAEGFDARMALIHNPFYAARQWVLLVHPGFTLMLALGVALALVSRAPGRATAGLAFAGVEKMTEFVLGTLIMFAVNGIWKVGYLEAIGTPEAAGLRTQIEQFNEMLGGSYFLLWSMFILSTACFGSALNFNHKLERWIIVTAGLMILLTFLMMLGSYAGQGDWVQPILKWSYPAGLTAHRLLIGLWLVGLAREYAVLRRAEPRADARQGAG